MKGKEMKKIYYFLLLILLWIVIFADPYRPYPVVFVHGYAANNIEKSIFGIRMLHSNYKTDIKNYIASSPVSNT